MSAVVYTAHETRSPTPPVYHFTDTITLPWILQAGELRPTRTYVVAETPLRAVWGSTNPEGDLTARPLRKIHTGGWEDMWQQDGVFELVRFTLPGDAFLSFNEFVPACTDWTSEQAAALIEYDRREHGEEGHALWRCRYDPIRLADVLKVETTSFAQVSDHLFEGRHSQWQSLDISRPEKLLIRSKKENRLGVRIGGKRFYSDRHDPVPHHRAQSYAAWPNPLNTPRARARRAEARLQDEIEYDRDMALWQRWAESEGLTDEDDDPPLTWRQEMQRRRRQLKAELAALARPQPCPW